MTRAAGADMAEMARFTPLDAYEFARLGQETFAAIERMPCLTIATIDGDCFGGALDPATLRMVKELTIHCDRLTQRELLTLAERLGALYNASIQS